MVTHSPAAARGFEVLCSFHSIASDTEATRSDAAPVWNLRASQSIRTSNSTRTLNHGYRGKLRVAPAGCLPCLALRAAHGLNHGCEYVRSEHDDETVESATLAGCTAPVGPALSCRLTVIGREWRAYGKLGTDVLTALASLRTERSPERDSSTCQRLCDWAKTACDLYTIDLSSTFTCKAEAVGKRIHRGGATEVWRCGTLFFALVPVVYLLRNLRLRRVQRPYAVVHRHPVDDSWGLKTVARSQRLCDIAATYVPYRGSGEYRADALCLIERRYPVNTARFVSFAFDFNLPSGRRANRGGAECKLSGAQSETWHDTLRHHLGNGEKDCPDQGRKNL